jgi:hypothetical protein
MTKKHILDFDLIGAHQMLNSLTMLLQGIAKSRAR